MPAAFLFSFWLFARPQFWQISPLKANLIFHLPTTFLELCIDLLGLGILPYDARIL
jgi:hypothetical protein